MKEVAKSEVIVGQLQQVFDSDQSRTKMGRLREMFDAIEQKRDGGMSLENIRSVLEKNNFVISLSTLTKSLQRISQERGIERGAPVAEPKLSRAKKIKSPKTNAKGKSPAAPDSMDKERPATPHLTDGIGATAKQEPATMEKLKDLTRGPFDPNQFNDDSE